MQYSQECGSQVCPTAVLDRVWRWNYRRGPLQDKLGESIFVPKIMFMKGPQFVRTALVWPDACPILMPKTDTLLIFRKELAESLDEEDEPEIIEVEWSKFEPLITRFPYDEVRGCYKLDYDDAPSALSKLVRSLKPSPFVRESMVPNDGVLNAELIAKVRKSK
ncbi:hypothetical protein FGO68_gene995 [Halteria grandinella]|uniref:Uncharacterized protein n=1 Tax=Halteria grandinella TaxID=5974 RepID=A0A8J8N9Y7_HALGN|nr:hypothetical protein FGO68_gene995 [Halteria grandinella]